jgi:hypothetical protein
MLRPPAASHSLPHALRLVLPYITEIPSTTEYLNNVERTQRHSFESGVMSIHDYYFQRDQLFAVPPCLVDLKPGVKIPAHISVFASFCAAQRAFSRNKFLPLLAAAAPFLWARLMVHLPAASLLPALIFCQAIFPAGTCPTSTA